MKAISVHQPWASMIAMGEKKMETRTWKTCYRGRLLIVSTKWACEDTDLPLGKALCVVRLVDCRVMKKADEAAACCRYRYNLYSWVFGSIIRIKPFAAKRKQGIYEVTKLSDELEELVLSF